VAKTRRLDLRGTALHIRESVSPRLTLREERQTPGPVLGGWASIAPIFIEDQNTY